MPISGEVDDTGMKGKSMAMKVSLFDLNIFILSIRPNSIRPNTDFLSVQL